MAEQALPSHVVPGQAMSQDPQCAGSTAGSTHTPSHAVRLPGQGWMQRFPEQTFPPEQSASPQHSTQI
jgi:hypothetical protein